jgi:hypothetical protein
MVLIYVIGCQLPPQFLAKVRWRNETVRIQVFESLEQAAASSTRLAFG